MHSPRPVALAVACLLIPAFAPTAQAKLPKTETNRIVPGKEVAGVKLGMTMKRAGNVWKMEEGHGCFREFGEEDLRCMFELRPSGANYNTGNISYYGKKTVKRIVINCPRGNGFEPDFSSKMNRYKTSKGSRIGATKGKLDNEFGGKLKRTERNGAYTSYTVVGPKKAKTTFVVYSRQVSSITLSVG